MVCDRQIADEPVLVGAGAGHRVMTKRFDAGAARAGIGDSTSGRTATTADRAESRLIAISPTFLPHVDAARVIMQRTNLEIRSFDLCQ